ncbi:MAG TPA: arginine decarboxylase, partial [Spongiibacteraceae bacterium]|nr:arginine decarboxylase [Spongiibacteraceae bacterium]
GDMHNLFGDTHSVHVQLDEQGGVEYRNPLTGDTVSDMLHYVDYDTGALVEKYRKKLAASGLPDAQQEAYLDELVSGLSGYCYLED